MEEFIQIKMFIMENGPYSSNKMIDSSASEHLEEWYSCKDNFKSLEEYLEVIEENQEYY